ncbi:MAG TPA: undecaprenyl-diphosphate phosphatase [Terriglobales bacterium]|nr:undecaprenyl-diphosphate phosphatase [Terriglobales bacterium]
MSWMHIVILAAVQGLTELLPVSSSAHVIVAAELLHENMSTPANALLLVLLHTGTMFAVVAYFWRRWTEEFLFSWATFRGFAQRMFAASLLSGLVGYPIILLVEHTLGDGGRAVAIEALFHKLNWIAPPLAIAGLLIVVAGLREARAPEDAAAPPRAGARGLAWPAALAMGALQGLAIPFRGFSRSGSTISGGLLANGKRAEIESFSFAMAVAITPLALGRELWREVAAAHRAGAAVRLGALLAPGL